jgi:hypothetical protein
MSGTNYNSEVQLSGTTTNWKIVGVGDFGIGPAGLTQPNQPDIVWQDTVNGYIGFWFMNGTNWVDSYEINFTDPNWQVVGVGDINRDGYNDLIFYHKPDGYLAYWLMTNYTSIGNGYMSPMQEADTNWNIVGVAPFPQSTSTPALIWRDQSNGMNAVWYMSWQNNTWTMTTNYTFVNSANQLASVPDQDYRIVGAWDVNSDGYTDLLWHHATLGLNASWFMTGPTNVAGGFPVPPEYNLNWKVASQDMVDSTWNLNQVAAPNQKATVVSSSQVNLTFPLSSGWSGYSFNLYRRANSSSWQLLQSNLTYSQIDSAIDTTVQSGNVYDYRWVAGSYTGSWVTASVAATPAFYRGKVILLVDTNLYQTDSADISWSVSHLKTNLIGDGWQIVGPHYVARHDDTYDPNQTNLVNQLAQSNILQIVRTDWAMDSNNTKGVIILGHVTIPYSGNLASDGHQDHSGAWPADTLYGFTITNVWDAAGNDTSTTINNTYVANSNVPGDGKYDLNASPGPFQLFVGRIDFANLPSFNTSTSASVTEGNLLRQYISKTENYRKNQAPFPVQNIGRVHGTFNNFIATGSDARNEPAYNNIKWFFDAAVPSTAASLVVGDPFRCTPTNYSGTESSSCLWGFLAGSGMSDSIGAYAVMSGTNDWLGDYSANLAAALSQTNQEPQVAFYGLFGSYFMDWNMSNDLLRSTLATSNYGVAAIILSDIANDGVIPVLWNYDGFRACLKSRLVVSGRVSR